MEAVTRENLGDTEADPGACPGDQYGPQMVSSLRKRRPATDDQHKSNQIYARIPARRRFHRCTDCCARTGDHDFILAGCPSSPAD